MTFIKNIIQKINETRIAQLLIKREQFKDWESYLDNDGIGR